MRSIVVGGVSEDKVSVHRGFRGCIQVGQNRGARPPVGSSGPLVRLLPFSE